MQCDIDFHSRAQMLTQYLNDLADRLTTPARLFGDFYHDNIAILGAHQLVRRDQEILMNALVVR